MTITLPDGRHVSVHSHSDKIWLSTFNGVGTVLPLDPDAAKDIGLALWRAGREASRPNSGSASE